MEEMNSAKVLKSFDFTTTAAPHAPPHASGYEVPDEDSTRDSTGSVYAPASPAAQAAAEAQEANRAAEQAMANAAKVAAEAREAKIIAEQAREAERAVAARLGGMKSR